MSNDCCGKVLLENQLPAGRMLLSTARDLAQVPTVCLSLALRCAFLRHSSVLGRKNWKQETVSLSKVPLRQRCKVRDRCCFSCGGLCNRHAYLLLRSKIAVRRCVKGSWLQRCTVTQTSHKKVTNNFDTTRDLQGSA